MPLVGDGLPAARRDVNGNTFHSARLSPEQGVGRQQTGRERYLVELGRQVSRGDGMGDMRAICQHFFQDGGFGIDADNHMIQFCRMVHKRGSFC